MLSRPFPGRRRSSSPAFSNGLKLMKGARFKPAIEPLRKDLGHMICAIELRNKARRAIRKETCYSHASIRIRPSRFTIANFLFPRGFQGALQILSWQNTAPLGGSK